MQENNIAELVRNQRVQKITSDIENAIYLLGYEATTPKNYIKIDALCVYSISLLSSILFMEARDCQIPIESVQLLQYANKTISDYLDDYKFVKRMKNDMPSM